jgi:hypothetical protein
MKLINNIKIEILNKKIKTKWDVVKNTDVFILMYF